MSFIRTYSLLLSGALILGACKKVKMDQRTGNLPTTAQLPNSTVRLVNLSGFTDLAINGQKLTNFVLPAPDGTRLPSFTPYFPTTGTLGTTYLIPQQFFNGYDTASVDLVRPIGNGMGNYVDSALSFTVKETYSEPNDYYWVLARKTNNSRILADSSFVFPRAVSPAADPTHVLVRLLNLSSGPDDASLVGPMSLAYADGSSVSAVTEGIQPGKASAYAELPYDAYQFKVLLTGQHVQVPGVPPSGDPSLSPVLVANQYTAVMNGSGLTYAPVQSFLPGGVYTIVVSPNFSFSYPYGGFGQSLNNYYNSFQVITDVSPAANVIYSQLQAVNAIPGSILSISVDGTPLSQGLAYDSAGDYQAYVTGAHQVTVQDADGKQLGQASIQLQGGTSFTIWAYPSGTGGDGAAAGILFTQNNLSGSRNTTFNGDGSDAGSHTTGTSFPFWVRFVNLCPDLPYVSFTQASGVPFADGYYSTALAAQNLPFGGQLSSSAVPFPYVSAPSTYIGSQIAGETQVYQSQPSEVPGNWLRTIPSLRSTDFVNMPAAFYPGGLPAGGEPGVYTVALTGRYGPDAPAGQAAKMIIIKHTK